MKAKTAESEEQWVKLKADFAERKRFIFFTEKHKQLEELRED